MEAFLKGPLKSSSSATASSQRPSSKPGASRPGRNTENGTMSTSAGPNNDEEVLADGSRNILMGLLAQLRKGTDLHRVTLPTFVLEPRSMLERVTDFFLHPELILATPQKTDPIERFVDVVRFFLSGWYLRPKGVKKPYNPVLGENFRCRWKYDGKLFNNDREETEGYYVAEQVSHHPPISCWFFASPENAIIMTGDVKPRSKFLGNSAVTLMDGETRIYFSNFKDEVYVLNSPNIYARGLLFGTMIMELGDTVTIRCQKSDLVCVIEFKTKGFFSGTYNSIGGKIRRGSTNETLYELSGKWSDVMYIKKTAKSVSYEPPSVLFDSSQVHVHPTIVATEDEQEMFESRRLWRNVTDSIRRRDLDAATDYKNAIEEGQRQRAKWAMEKGTRFIPRFFVPEDHLVSLGGCSISSLTANSHLAGDSESEYESVKSELSSSTQSVPINDPGGGDGVCAGGLEAGKLGSRTIGRSTSSTHSNSMQQAALQRTRSLSAADRYCIGPGSPANLIQKLIPAASSANSPTAAGSWTTPAVSGSASNGDADPSTFNVSGVDYFHFRLTEFPNDPKLCKQQLEQLIFTDPPLHPYIAQGPGGVPLPEEPPSAAPLSSSR